jgi:transcriptional regulator
VFQGEGAYVSPSLYEAKTKDGKVVPTWNYVAVHAYGKPRVVTDPAWLHELVSDLTDTHEAAREVPWRVSDAPSDYVAKMLGAIVGIEIPITRLLGKWKVSQNRTSTDRAKVAADLGDSAPEISSIVAATNHT